MGGHSSVSKMHVIGVAGPNFSPQHPHKKLVTCTYNISAGEVEARGSLVSLVNQPQTKVSAREPFSKDQMDNS